MLNEKLFQQVSNRIKEYRSQMIDFQKEITRIPALSPTSGGEGEWDKAMYIKEFLQAKGVKHIELL